MSIQLTAETTNHPPSIDGLPNPHQGLRCLLAEDCPSVRKTMEVCLGKIGYQAHLAENGSEALQLLKKNPYDFAIFDKNMPVMCGHLATKKWRKIETGTPLPIIVCTDCTNPEEINECLENGMTDYLPKPTSIQEIKRIVSKHVIEPRSKRPNN